MTSSAPLSAAAVVGRVFLPFAAGYFLSYLYRSVNAVIGPDLTRSLSLDPSQMGLLTSTYFLAFASSQLPLGLLLDRFGPRRVEAALLLFAAAGALAFALAGGLTELVVGRALIGFGVSACLMASFKANVLFFDRQRLPLVNGVIMASGGLGALSATAPVEAALHITDWRGVFLVLAGLTLAEAVALFLLVPERKGAASAGTLGHQLREMGQIYGSALFWRQAPLPMVSQAAFMAIQGLWAGPWLRDVARLDRGAAADHLFAMAAGMVAGFILMGALAERLSRLGIPPVRVAAVGMALFLADEALIASGWTGAPYPMWLAFGFLGTSGTLMYAALSQQFPPNLAGRVNTALNLLVFVAAFAAQWGMGQVIDLWPKGGLGYPPEAYRAAFGMMLALQGLALVWLALGRSRSQRPKM
jgi:MFS family permease